MNKTGLECQFPEAHNWFSLEAEGWTQIPGMCDQESSIVWPSKAILTCRLWRLWSCTFFKADFSAVSSEPFQFPPHILPVPLLWVPPELADVHKSGWLAIQLSLRQNRVLFSCHCLLISPLLHRPHSPNCWLYGKPAHLCTSAQFTISVLSMIRPGRAVPCHHGQKK